MKLIGLATTLVLTILFVGDTTAACFRRNCVSVSKVAVVHQKVVQIVPAAITFVPSQVLLNSQVTLYNPNNTVSGLGYTYQGSVATVTTQASGDRLARVEDKLDALIEALGAGDKVRALSAPSAGWGLVLQNNCMKCHGVSPKDNELSMVNADGTLKDKLPRYEMYRRMTLPVNDKAHMPKKGPMVKNAELEIIRAWVNVGLKDLEY